MYKVIYKAWDGLTYTYYGFSNKIVKRIQSLIDDPNYEIIWIVPLCFSWSVFKKCLTNKWEWKR
jgi:hypothetical protein